MSSESRNSAGRARTIGSRLTLWGTGTTLAVCLLVYGLLYCGFHLSLHDEVDSFLEGEVMEFRSLLAEKETDYAVVEREVRRELGSRTRRDLFFRLLDARGGVLVAGAEEDLLPDPFPLEDAPPSSSAACFFRTVTAKGTALPIRICSQWIDGPRGARQVAQAGYLLVGVNRSLARVLQIGAAVMAAAVALAYVGGRVLAARSLSPIRSMIETARRIGATRLRERIPCTTNGDELDQLAATLNAMLDRIEAQVRQMQRFTADAAHELRTPLAALRGVAEVALTQPRSAEDLRRVVEDSIEHYDRLARIADDLLLLARFDAGEPIVRIERTRVDRVVEDVVDLYAPLAADRELKIEFMPHEEIWAGADGARLRQLLGNLLDNAVRHAHGARGVQVSLRRTNGRVELAVQDDGPGIPAEDQPHIFDRFYRADRARAGGQARGAGLGLAICRSIAEAHGGRIELFSAPGTATVVTVVLPLRPTSS